MYDSVDLSVIPKEPHAVAAYINGRYANYEDAKRLFPNARILTISVTGLDTVADAYDIEAGDYSTADVSTLYKVANEHGVWRPCFYASLDTNMPGVKSELNKVVKTRDDVRLWVAYYNEQSDLPSGYDAHQFTETALGRNLDESICASNFFPATTPKPATTTEAKPATVEVAEWETVTLKVGLTGAAKGHIVVLDA